MITNEAIVKLWSVLNLEPRENIHFCYSFVGPDCARESSIHSVKANRDLKAGRTSCRIRLRTSIHHELLVHPKMTKFKAPSFTSLILKRNWEMTQNQFSKNTSHGARLSNANVSDTRSASSPNWGIATWIVTSTVTWVPDRAILHVFTARSAVRKTLITCCLLTEKTMPQKLACTVLLPLLFICMHTREGWQKHLLSKITNVPATGGTSTKCVASTDCLRGWVVSSFGPRWQRSNPPSEGSQPWLQYTIHVQHLSDVWSSPPSLSRWATYLAPLPATHTAYHRTFHASSKYHRNEGHTMQQVPTPCRVQI